MLTLVEIPISQRRDYLEFLLLADEQLEMVEKYMFQGKMYGLKFNQQVCATCLIIPIKQNWLEIKNLAVLPTFQRQKLGSLLLKLCCQKYQSKAKWVYVGTGESPITLNFYSKCGFHYSHRLKNFFLDNYDHPIYEGNTQLIDMIYLKKQL